MANSVDPDQTVPIGAVCSGSTLLTSILNSSVMLGKYLQQTTLADDIFRCIFFLALKRVCQNQKKMCLNLIPDHTAPRNCLIRDYLFAISNMISNLLITKTD